METTTNNRSPNPTKSKMLHALIYFVLGASFVLVPVPPLTFDSVFGGVLSGFFGSFVSALFLMKVFAAGAGSASTARMMPTLSNVDFWIKVGTGLIFSVVFSPLIYGLVLRYLPADLKPYFNIFQVLFLMGGVGNIVLKAVTDAFRTFGKRSTGIADSLADVVQENIERLKPKKKKP